MKKYILILFTLLSFCQIKSLKAQYIKLLDFSGYTGGEPHGSLFYDGNFMYGMTFNGGTHNGGAIFKMKPDGSLYAKLFDFDSTTDGAPFASLISDGTYLFGMTNSTIFKIKTDGTDYHTLLNFTGINGAGVLGSLVYDGTFLYGMTFSGGANICDQYGNGCGVLFKIKSDGTGYSKLLDFGASTTYGVDPRGSLFYDGTYLYGITSQWGHCIDCGTVFKIKTDGTDFSNIYEFDGYANAGKSVSTPISDGTFLYAMTPKTIFKIKPDGSAYSKLHDFTLINGTQATGSLFYDGVSLYGMTREGGTSTTCPGGCGVVFKINTDGTGYTKLLDFDGATGGDPMGSLISDGAFLYGMTRIGGVNNEGVVFKLGLSTTGINTFFNAANESSMSIYPNPTNNFVTIDITSSSSKEEFIISLSNSIGEIVYREKIKEVSGSLTKQIDLTSFPKGIYFAELQSTISQKTARKINKKIVLQ